MELNVKFVCEIKDVKRALALLKLDIPSDEEIIARFQDADRISVLEYIEEPERSELIMAWVAIIEGKRQEMAGE